MEGLLNHWLSLSSVLDLLYFSVYVPISFTIRLVVPSKCLHLLGTRDLDLHKSNPDPFIVWSSILSWGNKRWHATSLELDQNMMTKEQLTALILVSFSAVPLSIPIQLCNIQWHQYGSYNMGDSSPPTQRRLKSGCITCRYANSF
jgi:hypothetical protein